VHELIDGLQFLGGNIVAITIGGLVFGAIYALIALGYTMVYGVLQLINFAHSEVFMYGTFATLWTLYFLNAGPDTTGWTLILYLTIALLMAMLVSALVALALERLAYRPLLKRGAPRLIALISAIGLSFVLAELMGLRGQLAAFVGLDGPLAEYVSGSRDTRGMPAALPSTPLFNIGGYTVRPVDIVVIVTAVGMMVLVDQFVRRSRLGRGIRAVAQDPESAALMGVNATRVIQLTFLIGGLMAGAAAFLYMLDIQATRFNAGFILGVKAFTAAVMGGIGNLRGALLGGFVLGVTEAWGAAVFGQDWKDVIAFVLLVVILLFRPSGLLGESLGRSRA
jgi:branched-chain amino acid transport system permease protein